MYPEFHTFLAFHTQEIVLGIKECKVPLKTHIKNNLWN